jgi:GT2 family glycosyltransferase/glycosyltransferase involved in cell wall biosynthesis
MLEVCLKSLLASEDVDLEIVVLLNGCDEDLPPIASESLRVHTVEAGEPVGFSAANNLGVEYARRYLGEPEFYYFINNDTKSDPSALVKLVEAIENEPRCAVAGPLLMIEWAPDYINSLGLNVTEDAWAWDEGIGIHRDEYGAVPPRRQVLAVTGSALLVDSKIFRGVGGWTELYDYYFEDIDLCLKVQEMGHRVILEPAAMVSHHVSATMTLESDHKLFLLWRNRLLLALVHFPLRHLARTLKIAVVDEILCTDLAHNRLQRRALTGALRKIPTALGIRRLRRRNSDWLKLLEPRGSVPVITLPPRRDESVREAATTSTEGLTGGDGVAEPSEGLVPDSTWDSARALEKDHQAVKKVLVIGAAPLPFENARMNFAPGARTWQFARGLAYAGHSVCIAAVRIPGGYDGGAPLVEEARRENVLIYRLAPRAFHLLGVLDGLVTAYEPDVVVGAATSPSLRAAELSRGRPLWVDLFGDPMAEAQARATRFTEGDQLTAYRDMLVKVLERGDAFSAVSDRQRYAAIGQLGLVGRLNRHTAGLELVHTVPCCILEPEDRPPIGEIPQEVDEIDDRDFVVLWSGGFNTWCDVDTLVKGLEGAMERDRSIRFVSTGGEITGHDDSTYRRFTDHVTRSRFRERFVVKGALSAQEAAAWRARADLGVVTENEFYERVLGSSGRVTSWLESGLPFVCAACSEQGAIVAAEGFGNTYEIGDAKDLARVVVEAAGKRENLRKRADRARQLALSKWGVLETTEPLRVWVTEGNRLPDANAENPISIVNVTEGKDQEILRLRTELDDIHGSRMWKVWMAYIAATNPLRRVFRRLSGSS